MNTTGITQERQEELLADLDIEGGECVAVIDGVVVVYIAERRPHWLPPEPDDVPTEEPAPPVPVPEVEA